tara:strand:+ start:530 stop:1261 length:732 start_codon:yes stop_codon:yes gene_type:complete
MSSWEGWSDPIGRQATPQPKGPPKAVLGPPIDNPYGFLVAEETFEKVTRRVKYAEIVADLALRGKRIQTFNEAPHRAKFWQHAFNDADAYAHVAYWIAVAAMGTGNKSLANAAKKYANAADRWDTVFLRLKDGGVATIYQNATKLLLTKAGKDRTNSIVKRVVGIFSQQGDPDATASARRYTLEQDPIQQAGAAVKKTVTTPPQLSKVPKWIWAAVGVTGILAAAFILRPYFQAGQSISRRSK